MKGAHKIICRREIVPVMLHIFASLLLRLPTWVHPQPGRSPAHDGYADLRGVLEPRRHFLDGELDLTRILVRNRPATFLWRVSGHSMRDAGIFDGDVVVVDRSVAPWYGTWWWPSSTAKPASSCTATADPCGWPSPTATCRRSRW
ncbi:LexA family protein [Tianweitania sp.]|uniref:LexA family protein n=1 Tax=Tianweitania sp. TaxID=2021634 RepID=UPI00289D9E32|nr:S24 family peptidase [Tianweitania sp.]